MTRLPAGADAALAPLRDALLMTARNAAAKNRETAAAAAAALLEDAARESAAIRAKATAAGESVARSEASLRSARVRRKAQEVVFAAQNEVWLRLRSAVREAASALRHDCRYPEVQEMLRAQALARLGPDAVVVDSSDGGVVASAGSRRLDMSLPTLAEDILGANVADMSDLWAAP